ncbi:MAG: hypothetical protein ACRYFX_17035 [Janthinobacterium lividum]
MQSFALWLKFEAVDFTSSLDLATGEFRKVAWNNKNDFCNIGVTLPDGRHYSLNVWTYGFLATAVRQDAADGQNLAGTYRIPPDLLVRELTRDCLEATIADLLRYGDLENVLNPSVGPTRG